MSHYFDKNVKLASCEKEITTKIKDINLKFITDNGVFSKNRLDFGTELLLSNYKENSLVGPILDMCSGWGPVGVYLAKTTTEDIYMTEINERAYLLSLKNLSLNDVKAYVYNANLFEGLPNILFKDILVNPPIRAGKTTVFEIYEGAFERLVLGGALWVVIQNKQGAPSTINKLKELNFKVEIITKKAGYNIIRAIK